MVSRLSEQHEALFRAAEMRTDKQGQAHEIFAVDPPPARGASIARSSTIVFHSPQPGQRPCHLGLSFPHWEQTKRVLAIHPR